MSDTPFEFVLGVEDFDRSQLPSHARQPGTDAFAAEVTKLLEREYAPFGGHVAISVDSRHIHVRWTAGTLQTDPLGVAVGRLQAGDYESGVALLQTLNRHQPG